MGVVYKAQQISTNREVALKIVKLDLGDDARIERFQQEIDIISQLSHPNVVRVYDAESLEKVAEITDVTTPTGIFNTSRRSETLGH